MTDTSHLGCLCRIAEYRELVIYMLKIADERWKRLFKNILGTAAIRAVSLLITLAMVPLTINALSLADYAVLSVALSIALLSSYADLGMGSAVVNVIAGASADVQLTRARRAVSIVWFSLFCIAIGGLVLSGIIAVCINALIAPIHSKNANAILLAVGFVFVGLPTGLVQRILFARQRSVEANLWATGSRLVSLGLIYGLVLFDTASLNWLVFAVVGVPALMGWLSALLVFKRPSMKDVSPSWSNHDWRLLKPYLMLGASYLVMQMVPYAESGIDNLIAGSLIDIEIVPSLDVHSRLFTYITAVVSIGIFPLWPAIASAYAGKDLQWVLAIRKWMYLMVALLTTITACVFVGFAEPLVLAWTGKPLRMDSVVIYGMAMLVVLTSIGMTQTMILSGLGVIKAQVKIYAIYVLALLIVKSSAAGFFGLSAMVWSANLCYLIRLYFVEREFHKSVFGKQTMLNMDSEHY